MKKLLRSLAAVALFGGFATTATAQYDLSTDTILFPVDGGSYQAGIDLPLEYVNSNAGTVDIPATDTVLTAFFLDGTFVGTLTRTPATFVAGTSDTTIVNFPFATLPAGQYQVCALTTFLDTNVTDTVSSNNVACSIVNLVAPDVELTNFEATSPALASGDTLPTGDTIVTMSVTITNTGTIPVISNVPTTVYIGTDSVSLSAPVGTLLPDSSVTLNLPGSLLPEQPTAAGPFDLCAMLDLALDADNSNDQVCNTYIRPDTATNSVVDVFGTSANAYFANGEVIIESEQATGEVVNVAIYSITGKEVLNRNVSLTNRVAIPFSSVSNGVYIMKIGESAVKFVK